MLLAVAVFVYLADVISKIVVVATLSGHPPIRLLGGFLTLRVLRNSGAAFSIGTSMTVVFTLIAVAVIVVILRTSWRLRSLPWAIALGLLLGGATGNLTDRLLRSPGVFRGDVVDWIQVPHWPVFNLADSSIVCGVILWALLLARGVPLNGRAQEPARRDGPDGRRDEAGARDPSAEQVGRDTVPRLGANPGSGPGAAPDTRPDTGPGSGPDRDTGRGAAASGRGTDAGSGDNRA